MTCQQNVYLFRMNSEPPVYKIGVSHHPERRITQYRLLPWTVELVHVIKSDSGGAIEDYLHHRFCDELFRLSDADVEQIKQVKEANSLGDLPADLRPRGNTRFVQRRTRRNGKPYTYKTYSTRERDPSDQPIQLTSEKALAVCERIFQLRNRLGIDLRDFHPFIIKGAKWNRCPFNDRGESALREFERGVMAFTISRLVVYAANMRMTLRELLGEHVDIVPEDCRDSRTTPDNLPDDWFPNWRAEHAKRLKKYNQEREWEEFADLCTSG